MKLASILLLLPALALAAPSPPRIISPVNPSDPEKLPSGVTKKVLVVGGGIAGLSAALELAERGFDVTLKEARDHLGGRLDAIPVQPFGPNNGTTFNTIHGFHAWFYNYFNFDNILDRLNLQGNFRPWEKVEYIFRNYKPETIFSEGPYPLNLLGILTRSPNLNILNGLSTTFALPDLVFYNYENVYQKYDGLTLKEWAAQKKVGKVFYDIIMDPAVSVTLNDRDTISAAEMLNLMHIYFLSSPKADVRKVLTKPFNTGVIDPWAERLRQLGVKIQLSAPVQGLRFKNAEVVAEVGTNESYDFAIIAADLPGQKAVLAGSVAEDDLSQVALDAIRSPVNAMPIARPYKVIRVWFDKKLPAKYPDIIETPEHRPINLVAQFHLLEDECIKWSNETGGGVMEFHIYDIADPSVAAVTDAAQIWEYIKPTALEIAPELATLKPIGFNLNSYDNFPSFPKGLANIRPYVDTPAGAGIPNLAFAGDWVSTKYPSFIMERAVSTGREAANVALLRNKVKQVPLKVVSNNGPGLTPGFKTL
ncbi:hypothetical protein HK102_004643 [Quaeritorhiza haematococci]|nr:hypothetical protein HK102_004643 [Quaeritorhiza haematococci]